MAAVLVQKNFAQCILYALDNCAEADRVNRIDIEIIEMKGLIKIKIKDNGLGYSIHVLERVGEPFLTTKKDGTGLGLYSIQHFCQSINGEMKLYNNDGGVIEIDIPKNQEEDL